MADEKNMSQEEMVAAQKQNCIFCKIIKKEVPAKIIYSDKLCTAILDINPANEGHILLIPNDHYQIMPQIPDNILAHMGVISKKLSKALLISTLGKSTSIFVANGPAAGQKAPHFIIHIIPRKKDSEFFKIPIKEINPNDIDKLSEVLIKKLEMLLGKKTVEKKVIEEVQAKEQISEIPYQEHVIQQNNIQNQTFISNEHNINKAIDTRKIHKLGIKKEKGYLYFVDEEGDISRVPMARGRKSQKFKKEKVTKNEDDFENEPINEEKETKKQVTLDDISNLLLGGKL